MGDFDPERIIRTLMRHQVEFLVIGAGAAWLQGNPVATVDLDVMPRKDVDNAERLAAGLNDLEPRINGRPVVLEERDLLGWPILELSTAAGPVDIVPTAVGVGDYNDLVDRAVRLEIEGELLLVASLDDVIRSKEALGRPKDVAALPLLRETRDRLRELKEE